MAVGVGLVEILRTNKCIMHKFKELIQATQAIARFVADHKVECNKSIHSRINRQDFSANYIRSQVREIKIVNIS